jgi:hypothetical protein
VIDAPASSVPIDIVVEVARDDARSLGQEPTVLGERAPQRAELMLAADATTAVLRPYGKQVACNGPADAHRRDMAQG